MPVPSALKTGKDALRAAASRIRFSDCEIYRQTHELLRQGQPQSIRRKAFDVLLLLVDQAPQTLRHDQIAREIWGSKQLSAKHVARAVMEARRCIGDDPDVPRFILSVRGVGYRFAGDVSYADSTLTPETAELGSSAREARADIEAAASCLRRGDFEDARRLADRAISTADLADARPELARALALASCVLLRIGGHDRALAMANKALLMAQRDGRSEVVADAQVALAEVQLWMGSAHAALDHLLAAHRVLAGQRLSHSLWRCESVLSHAYREIGRVDEAWPWCERALASALHLEPESRALRERLVMVSLLSLMMDDALADGRPEDLNASGLRALDLLEAIEADARTVGAQGIEVVCCGYRAVTLETMGRVDECWAVLEQLRPALFGDNMASTTWLEFRRKEFRQVEAGLLSRCGRNVEAIQAIEAVIETVQKESNLPTELSIIFGMAAQICERAARYPEALMWMRRQQRALAKLHADRAQATAGIVRAQLESDRLGEDLAQARAEVERQRLLNHQLQQRIEQMDRHPLLDEDGLVPAGALAASIDARAALARARELPMCVGLVEALVPGDEESATAELLLRSQLQTLSSLLKALIPGAPAAAQWRAGLYFFIIADMGLGPARQRCQALAQRLNAQAMPILQARPVVRFRIDAVDVTRFNGIEAAMAQLPSLEEPAL